MPTTTRPGPSDMPLSCKILAWRLSPTIDLAFCLDAPREDR